MPERLPSTLFLVEGVHSSKGKALSPTVLTRFRTLMAEALNGVHQKQALDEFLVVAGYVKVELKNEPLARELIREVEELIEPHMAQLGESFRSHVAQRLENAGAQFKQLVPDAPPTPLEEYPEPSDELKQAIPKRPIRG